MKVLLVFGTRPEAIKMAPVVHALKRHPERFCVSVCVTGQHRHLLDQVLELFGIAPDHDLNLMRPGQSLADVTASVLRELSTVLERERPDWVLVQGDTTTAMAAGLAAFYQQLRVGHIEAGLRTHDNSQPFPEEVNRRVIAVLANIHFAPTAWAASNLRSEGIPDSRVLVTGNTGIDALGHISAIPFEPAEPALARLAADPRTIVLATTHRRENFGQRMQEIAAGLRDLARIHPGVHLVCPLHPNPNAQGPLCDALGDMPNVTLLPPLNYQPLVWLLKRCHFVITDSGGLQEEAPGLGKPVLVLRETTERPEGVAAGTVRMVGPSRARIVAYASQLLTDPQAYARMAQAVNPYGDGHAAERIATALTHCEAPTQPAAPVDQPAIVEASAGVTAVPA